MTWAARGICAAACLPYILVALHGAALLPLAWSDRVLSAPQHVGGFNYAVPLATNWMSHSVVGESPAQLLEDGRPLRCPNADGSAITSQGLGRFRVDDGWVYFSASDNADPSSSGREYRIRWPTPVSRQTEKRLALLAVAGLVALVWLARAPLWAALVSPPVWAGPVVFLLVFVVHRWWFFDQLLIPSIQPDSGSYFSLAQRLSAGALPHFEIRPPAYPMFLALMLGLTHNLLGVVLAQTILTAAAACTMIHAAWRLRRSLALPVAVAMAAFCTGLWPIEHDTSILSESVYVSFIIFGFAFLLLAIATRHPAALAASSAALASAVLVRPAGLFVVVPYAFVVLYLIHNRWAPRTILAFAAPLPFLLLLLSTYNYAMSGAFAASAWGEANLAVATFTMWEPRAEYPDKVNAAIARVRASVQSRLTDAERSALASSWSPELLAPAFLKGFDGTALTAASQTADDYLESRRWIRRIAFDAISTHPATYAKFVWTMSYLYYVFNIEYSADFAEFIKQRVQATWTPMYPALMQDPMRRAMIAAYFQRRSAPGLVVGGACAAGPTDVLLAPTTAARVYWQMQGWRTQLFGSARWVYGFFVVFVLGLVRLIASRGRHVGAFVVVVVGLAALAAGLTVCLVEYAGQRYSYPMEFVYYLSIALCPLVLLPSAAAESS